MVRYYHTITLSSRQILVFKSLPSILVDQAAKKRNNQTNNAVEVQRQCVNNVMGRRAFSKCIQAYNVSYMVQHRTDQSKKRIQTEQEE